MAHALARYLLICGLLVATSSALIAQEDESNAIGLPLFGSFYGTDFDTVMFQNGNLHIQIPLASRIQRNGRTLNWKYLFDSPHWQTEWVSTPTPTNPKLGSYHVRMAQSSLWRISTPFFWSFSYDTVGRECKVWNEYSFSTIPYNDFTNFVVRDPEGTSHSLDGHASQGCGLDASHVSFTGIANDGSGIRLQASDILTATQQGTMTEKDGTQHHQNLPQTTDTNGNVASPASDSLGRSDVQFSDASNITYTSPLGKSRPGPAYTLFTVNDVNGSPQTFRIA